MPIAVLFFAALVAQPEASGGFGSISGSAVNGTQGQAPLADTEVVLRASQNGAFVPVAETTTDATGRFAFDELPLDTGIIYLAGVNRAGVHYPGPRIRLDTTRRIAAVKLIAYDAVESPSPLISRQHEITVQPGEGFLDITESLTIDNPGLTAYIGTQAGNVSSTTLRLTLPTGFDKVTFDKEFHGRNFQIAGGGLTTELPWPPGSRDLKFAYRVPVAHSQAILTRLLDLPTDKAILRVIGKDARSVTCNLPVSSSAAVNESSFTNTSPLLAGHQLELRLGQIPLHFESHGRWFAVATLAALVFGSIFFARRAQV